MMMHSAKRNQLANETSPYLLQHAENPVDWHPWGDEAFALARALNRPVFLSIGYSTCHWCHVMERESFEDDAVAAHMNKTFVCVKVDREERPDVDRLYMDFCQAMTGAGGWPLTIVMTPEKKPFFAATYLPRTARYGRTGMMELVARIQALWREDRPRIEETAEQIAAELARHAGAVSRSPGAGPSADAAFASLARHFDRAHGGFGGAPKFPTAHVVSFLARYGARTRRAEAREMAEKTLRAIRRGGIYDQLGFGVHRYATDAEWRTPHFEKMLYDQATLARASLDAFRAFGGDAHASMAREIFAYVLRDLAAPDGAFYTAEDADSEGVEGRFYLWRREEIVRIAGAARADWFARIYGAGPSGSFRDESDVGDDGGIVLRMTGEVDEIARASGADAAEVRAMLEEARQLLFNERARRVRPFRDEKVLTDLNGLMIGALAHGAIALDDPSLARAACRAADVILAERMTADGGLVHGNAGARPIPGMADDYAFLIEGLIALYGATFRAVYLERASVLNDFFIAHFWDDATGAFFSTADDEGGDLLFRKIELADGAIPSANSVAMGNLARLARLTGRGELAEMAVRIAGTYPAGLSEHPSACAGMLAEKEFMMATPCDIVIAGDPELAAVRDLMRAARAGAPPQALLLVAGPAGGSADLAGIVENASAYAYPEGGAAAYVCGNFSCREPVYTPETLSALLKKITGDENGS